MLLTFPRRLPSDSLSAGGQKKVSGEIKKNSVGVSGGARKRTTIVHPRIIRTVLRGESDSAFDLLK